MKKKVWLQLLVCFLLFYGFNSALAVQEADFSWTPNTEANLAGYKIHYGTASSQYDQVIDVGNPAAVDGIVLATVSGLSDETSYYFAATAYDTDGFESDFSQEVAWTSPAQTIIPPSPPPPLPVAYDLSLLINEDAATTSQLAGESLGGLPLLFQIVQNGNLGNATITDSSGYFSYVPSADVSGVDNITYIVSDANGVSNTATVTISIAAVDDPPIAGNSALTTLENEVVSGVLAATDIDSVQLQYAIDSNGSLGTAVINDSANGAFTYTPNENAFGEDSFQFSVTDGTSFSTAGVSVSIEYVEPVFSLETGKVIVDGNWTSVQFTKSFTRPVVVAKPASSEDASPCVIRICNVSSSGFDIRVQQYEYDFVEHGFEEVGFIVMEQGGFLLDNGMRLEAGQFAADLTASAMPVIFAETFGIVPVVVASIVTDNETDAVVGRISNVSEAGFEYEMQEEEASDQLHSMETVSYIAWQPSAGLIDDYAFEVRINADEVSDQSLEVAFYEGFTESPVLVADMQSRFDADPANVRYDSLTPLAVSLHVSEERSLDDEIGHSYEGIGFMAFSTIDLAADADFDGLLTGEERDLYGTSPALIDTDGDGLDDGVELEYWSVLWNVDSDADGIINLLDEDSDNDGYLDGEEVDLGFDPSDPNSNLDMVTDTAGPLWETATVPVFSQWQRISFAITYDNPVVIAKLVSNSDRAPCVIRVRNVDAGGFDIRLQEWDYLDDNHKDELASYVVMEAGSYILDNGARIEAGLFSSNSVDTFDSVYFAEQFTVAPVVSSSVTSVNEEDAVAARVWDIDTASFQFRMHEQESNVPVHAEETVSFIAWEPSSGVLNGKIYDVRTVSDGVINKFLNVSFTQTFTSTPAVLVDIQTFVEVDTATVRTSYVSESGFQVKVEEEKSYDNEFFHLPEQVGYMAFSPE